MAYGVRTVEAGEDRDGGDKASGGDLARQLRGYRITTAEILYHMPDHPGLLQTFLWQRLDVAPRFPELKRFLDFWTREVDAVLHSVRIAHAGAITPATWRRAAASLELH